MKLLKIVFGGVAILLGVLIYAWVLYNMFFPTKAFQQNASSNIGQYIFPALMIIVGYNWIKDSFNKDAT